MNITLYDVPSGYCRSSSPSPFMRPPTVLWRAQHFGDNTAWNLGRVSFNPPAWYRSVPAPMCCRRSCYGALAIPVRLRQAGAGELPRLQSPRIDMVLVALARPATNIALALLAATAFHVVNYLPDQRRAMGGRQPQKRPCHQRHPCDLQHAADPPLDGGRVAFGLPAPRAGAAVVRLEPYGMLILIGILILLPLAGSQFGLNLDVISAILRTSTGT